MKEGYDSMERVQQDCRVINNDDLRLKTIPTIPTRLVNAIYEAIQGMRHELSSSSSSSAATVSY